MNLLLQTKGKLKVHGKVKKTRLRFQWEPVSMLSEKPANHVEDQVHSTVAQEPIVEFMIQARNIIHKIRKNGVMEWYKIYRKLQRILWKVWLVGMLIISCKLLSSNNQWI